MKKLISATALISFSSILGVAGCTSARGDAARGQQVYAQRCVACHRADGAPQVGVEKILRVTMDPLGSEDVQFLSDAELKKIIREGKGKMDPVKGLSGRDVINLIAYIRSLASSEKK
jgi:mono/diheme cytochrome c family protein